MKPTCRLIALASVIACCSTGVLADTVKLSGSSGVVNLVKPHRAAVERLTGHTLEIVESENGNGLVDLAKRTADLAMVAERIDVAVSVARMAGTKIHPSALWMHELRKEEIVFLVHPSNPVGALTLEQLSDIHRGRLTNWKQVGGKDRPITVYSDEATGGTRAMVKKLVMRGSEYAAGVKSLASADRIAEMVAGDESGIGALGQGFVKADSRTKLIATTRISSAISLVTVGEPSAKVAQVIAAFKRAAAGSFAPVPAEGLHPWAGPMGVPAIAGSTRTAQANGVVDETSRR